MKKKLRVDLIANKLSSNKKKNNLSHFFKRIILKKFNLIKIGFIEVVDNNNTYYFGDNKSNQKVKVNILSSEFYTYLGTNGLLGVSEAYAMGLWKANDLVLLIRIVFQNKGLMTQIDSGLSKLMAPINYFIHLNRKNSLSGSKNNILAHYDLSNEFYKLWLDETMSYSCGYFKTESSSMKDASIEKLDRICRKINISSKDSVLEIGTGWGSFAIFAAKNYGCNITTTTISDAQYEYTLKKINDEGLDNKITLLKEDYRNLNGKYDKIVSIEMIEAVGYQYIPEYFNKVSNLLKNDGLFALQGITYNDQNFDMYKKSVDFIKKYIFPGSCLISITQITQTMKKCSDLSLNHLEDITMHYAETLKIWRNNFHNHIQDIKKLGFTTEFINLWEFYFVYCEAGFRERNIGDYQFIFSKPSTQNIKIEY